VRITNGKTAADRKTEGYQARGGRIVKKKVVVTLAGILIFLFSFIYVTASGISHLSNETALFLYLDETKGDPGTVEVASLAIFDNARLKVH
jgi:hypothetical protein